MRTLLFSTLIVLFPTLVFAADSPPKDEKSEAENLLMPTNDTDSWVLELSEDAKGEMKVDADAIVFKTTKTNGTDWHVQTYQTGLDLEDGKHYVVKFQMKSPDEVTVVLVGQIHEEDWHEIGLHEEIQPEKEYKDYEYEFTATDTVEENNRIGFVLGISEGEMS